MARDHTFAQVPELRIRVGKGAGKTLTTVLGGTWLHLRSEPPGDFVEVEAFGCRGWVKKSDVGLDDVVRMHFVDVGQGDGCLIESGDARVIVDGGESDNVLAYLRGFKYKGLILAGKVVNIDAVVVSHFDFDHYGGITGLLMDGSFAVDTSFHNGIARFATNKTKRPTKYQTQLGSTSGTGTGKVLTTSFDDLASLVKLRDEGGLSGKFAEFATACETAHKAGRLGALTRLSSGTNVGPFGELKVTVLGPVVEPGTKVKYRWLGDDSHTVNGHSVVLRLDAHGRSFLLGGDLNSAAEQHLLDAHDADVFQVDVFKACHHGSSDFNTTFLQAVSPKLTVISSGDDENYGHPEPDLIGALGKHSSKAVTNPLVFSTELARSTRGEKVTYGMINVRANSEFLLGAQFYDQSRGLVDPWHTFEVQD
jgi:beta-lactamase superfamily II metal-dependent hydrolase